MHVHHSEDLHLIAHDTIEESVWEALKNEPSSHTGLDFCVALGRLDDRVDTMLQAF